MSSMTVVGKTRLPVAWDEFGGVWRCATDRVRRMNAARNRLRDTSRGLL